MPHPASAPSLARPLLRPVLAPGPPSLLTPSGGFDRSAIMTAAWAFARAAIVPHRQITRFAPPPVPTLREAFKAGLRRAWDLARGYRASQQHFAAGLVEDARRATLPAEERTILNLRDARALAPMIDSTRRMVAEMAAIDAQLARLGVHV